ncbi:hypothetical protein QHH11_20180 [Aphanizomenon sp. PH219]|nr:hypothetical protein [Aphanizomenon sp. 202]MDK2461419.1 hypothetical protein [Aphanizomenon sp. PH219]
MGEFCFTTDLIVKYTLEPLVYEGVAEGKPQQEWRLKSAAELLQLKICDMAMGSGAFLVQTCRYLAERLVEAWENAEKANPGKVVVAPEGTLSKSVPQECVIPKEADERLLNAFREGADIPDGMGKALPDFDKLCPFHWELEFPEVFIDSSLSLVTNSAGSQKSKSSKSKSSNSPSPIPHSQKGFDSLVGNPPFMGGKKITGSLGTEYRDFIVKWIGNDKKGNSDFCAYFFLKAKHLLNENGGFGLIATNTISQGDTREVGLDQLIENCTIYRAVSSRTWPGIASLEVAYVWLRKGNWNGDFILDEKPVDGITAFLTNPGKASGNPDRLAANRDKSFQGSVVLGMGFVLTPEEAQALIEKDAKNQDVLFPYLNGQDLNTNPDQSPSRWVINFFDWPLDAEHDDPKNPKGRPYASDYPDCLAIVEEKVKPERTRLNEKGEFALRKPLPQKWWIYADKRPALYSAIAKKERVLVSPRVSKLLIFSFAPAKQVFSEQLVVFPINSNNIFALLNSSIHSFWAWQFCSTIRDAGIRYSPTDGFETFPFPTSTANLEEIGEKYYTHRQNIMLTRQEGLTKTYNRFHNPDETNPDIEQLRTLHIEMDNAVAAAYGWEDIELDHDFHETKQGIRFTICENARREILDRLLQLNHQRYAEEVAEGLHDKGKKKAKGGGKKRVQEEVNNDVKQIEMF